MKKKIIALLFLLLFLTGCGTEENLIDKEVKEETVQEDLNKVSNVEVAVENKDEILEEVDLSEKVDVIFFAYKTNGGSIDSYINDLKEKEPEGEFSVYNDEYYSKKITEKERIEYLKEFENGTVFENAVSILKNDEVYAGAILDVKHDDSFQNFEIYVDKEKYESNKFACSFGASLSLHLLSDAYQGYNFILPEARITEIKIIDNLTGQELEKQ